MIEVAICGTCGVLAGVEHTECPVNRQHGVLGETMVTTAEFKAAQAAGRVVA